MKRLVRCLLLFALGLAQHAFAGGIVHIADGDCAALTAAAAAPPGQESALIVLARNGTYNCGWQVVPVVGKIALDGAGALIGIYGHSSVNNSATPVISVAAGASLSLRNINLGSALPPVQTTLANNPGPKFCCMLNGPAIVNAGSLTLDSASIQGISFENGILTIAAGFFENSGSLVLRNVSVVGNTYGGSDPALLTSSGMVDISHSTFVTTGSSYAKALFATSDSGAITIGNSVVANNGAHAAPICAAGAHISSRGGNVFGDASCNQNTAPNDQVVADPRVLDFGTHGGVVNTLALNYDSPAIGNGLLANCEATDARGLARGQTACDSGAYEVGGGYGKLSATGMSGLYFNASNNGHYVSIQRLAGNLALVIWNTFDENGTPAWLYGVGTVNGDSIHVDQVAQNVGGILHPGGAVSGVTPTLWGTFDVDLSDCYTASLSYSSALPQFGSGSTTLQRLAFLDGVNCAH